MIILGIVKENDMIHSNVWNNLCCFSSSSPVYQTIKQLSKVILIEFVLWTVYLMEFKECFHVSSCLNIDIYMSIETFIYTAVAGIHLASNQNIIIDHSLFKSRFSADVWKCKDSLWIFLSITLKVFVLLLLHFHKVVWKLYFFSMIILLSLHSMD